MDKKENNRWVVKKPQSNKVKKTKNVNKIPDSSVLSWTSEEEKDDDSVASMDVNASELDRANFEAVRSQMANRIASIRTPIRQYPGNVVNPSPHPMQQLASNACNNS